MRVVAILETMWDWRGMTTGAGYRQAPRYFRINPENYSGKRLYKLVGPRARLIVTNACRELASSAAGHGKPDPEWLAENLCLLDGRGVKGLQTVNISGRDSAIDVLLVCGKVAQSAYRECGFEPERARVLEIPHPAARTWSKAKIKAVAAKIQGGAR